jgi:hypothetical protein
MHFKRLFFVYAEIRNGHSISTDRLTSLETFYPQITYETKYYLFFIL